LRLDPENLKKRHTLRSAPNGVLQLALPGKPMNKRLSGNRLKIHVSKRDQVHFPRALWLFHSTSTRDPECCGPTPPILSEHCNAVHFVPHDRKGNSQPYNLLFFGCPSI
jgi:hypothetical protein